MIEGLDRFAAHFAEYQDRYILIGGAATWLVLDEAGLDKRGTRDLDIVLCVEVLDAAFGAALWDFIQAGGYEIHEKSDGNKEFYRFRKPSQAGYPVMLELFSRKPDALVLSREGRYTPVPIGEDVSSLSAILMDDNYYEFLHEHKREIEGVSLVGEGCLIPLKARAWLDLTDRKAAGAEISSRDIRKHRGDVLRLYQLLVPGVLIATPTSIQKDISNFLKRIGPELDRQLLKNLGIKEAGPEEVLQTIRSAYGIEEE